MKTHFTNPFLLCVKTHFFLSLKTHFPVRSPWSGAPCININRKEVKCRSETPLPLGVFYKFCGYVWWCGCVWLPRKCGKVEKKIKFNVLLFFSCSRNYKENCCVEVFSILLFYLDFLNKQIEHGFLVYLVSL